MGSTVPRVSPNPNPDPNPNPNPNLPRGHSPCSQALALTTPHPRPHLQGRLTLTLLTLTLTLTLTCRCGSACSRKCSTACRRCMCNSTLRTSGAACDPRPRTGRCAIRHEKQCLQKREAGGRRYTVTTYLHKNSKPPRLFINMFSSRDPRTNTE